MSRALDFTVHNKDCDLKYSFMYLLLFPLTHCAVWFVYVLLTTTLVWDYIMWLYA